ncbi:hypothetical protein DID88_005965 [Monilinia fructigena]|uniref:AMP-dependent synthetase/ligase domain-containing protein n=1 Tax=Monilinia fructigena TaxID=38457 RepID=A0A395J1D8_9HELO|nr:hypothetical protein DID88_005965 [Monilinia fructigena]
MFQPFFDIIKRSSEKYGNAKAIGSRTLIKTHQEVKKVKKMVDGEQQEVDKKWTYFELSEYKYMSFSEYENLILQIGAGYRKLGLKKEDRVHIFAATSAHWLASAHGAVSQSMPIVTAYDTLGEEGLKHSLNEIKQENIDNLKKAHEKLKILSFEELRKLGEENPVEPVPPEAEDLCCIMYTSGSTGPPKGVPLKHKAVVAAVAGVNVIVEPYLGPVGVPAVWESVKKGIVAKVNGGSPVVKNLFWGALWAKSNLLRYGLPGAEILDALVFKKVKEATGGKLRICMNGGGPIAKGTQRFISMAITPMINGYGLTETTAMGALMDPMEWTDEALGDIPGSIEIKLVDFPDAGYYATNKPNPQGEIWIRGDSVMEERPSQHYFDRKKNLVKTQNGEYIALEKLESIYRSATVVANICVYADQQRTKPVALIVPAEPALKKLAERIGVEGSSIEELVHEKKIQDAVLKELQQAGKSGGLSGIEIIEGVVLGLVTSAQKLQRKKILEKFKKEVDAAYARND